MQNSDSSHSKDTQSRYCIKRWRLCPFWKSEVYQSIMTRFLHRQANYGKLVYFLTIWPVFARANLCWEGLDLKRSCTQFGMIFIAQDLEKSNSSRHLKAQFLHFHAEFYSLLWDEHSTWMYWLFWLCWNTARCNKQSLALFGSNLPNGEGKSSNFGDPLLSLRMTPCQEDLFDCILSGLDTTKKSDCGEELQV